MTSSHAIASMVRLFRLCHLALLTCLLIFSAAPLFGRDVQVATIQDLRAALASASPGDKIIVADGDYTSTRPLIVAKAGTKDLPIEISAQTVGKVEIKGSSGFEFESPAAYVVLRGF